MVTGVCSARPRPTLQHGRGFFKTGEAVWGRDVWHIQGDGGKTLCGRDSTEFLTIGETEIDRHCCAQCVSRVPDGFATEGC